MSILIPWTYSEQMLYCVVKITTAPPKKCATGFFLNELVGKSETTLLITNRHVAEGADSLFVHFQLAKHNGSELEPIGMCKPAEIPNYKDFWVDHPDSSYDLAALLLEPFILNQESPVFQTAISEAILDNEVCRQHLSAVEPVYTFGYPVGMNDEFDHLPIARSGITACHPGLNVQGASKGIVDLSAMHGCSGSPIVFIHERGAIGTKRGGITMGGERIFLLGILYGGPVYTNGKISTRTVMDLPSPGEIGHYPINLGYYVKACELPPLIEQAAFKVSELVRKGIVFEKPFAIPMQPTILQKSKTDS